MTPYVTNRDLKVEIGNRGGNVLQRLFHHGRIARSSVRVDGQTFFEMRSIHTSWHGETNSREREDAITLKENFRTSNSIAFSHSHMQRVSKRE